MFPIFLQLTHVLEEPVFEPRYLNMEYIFNKILQFARALYQFLASLSSPDARIPSTPDFGVLPLVGWFAAVILFAALLAVFYKIWTLKWEEHKRLGEKERESLEAFDHTEHNLKWQKVLELLGMINESDWRLAIIEADNILADLLQKMGYVGDTIGDKLKAVEPSDFLSLDAAWEAHKVRNRVAHEGTNFRLSHREAQRVIGLYQKVFEEFHYI